MALTKEEARAIAVEVKQGIVNTHNFLKRPRDEKILILREALDMEIGDDPGAMFPTIPGLPLPAGFIETMTDPLLDKFAEIMLKIMTGE